jgi:CRISPR/Cas system CSM-associated protein Csm4 (group 5 of RAMP superfamily)
MSDKFESLDANKKAALESTLYRCRALVGRIAEELRKKKPEHFVDEGSLADFHACLERAALVLEQKTAKACRRGAVSGTGN